jgi:hypothetical protein
VKDYAPQDQTLHRIADELQSLQRTSFYRLRAMITNRGHYSHAYSAYIDVFTSTDENASSARGADDQLRQLLRDFMNWIYRRLEEEYDYQTSEKALTESIEANDYEFDQNGALA